MILVERAHRAHDLVGMSFVSGCIAGHGERTDERYANNESPAHFVLLQCLCGVAVVDGGLSLPPFRNSSSASCCRISAGGLGLNDSISSSSSGVSFGSRLMKCTRCQLAVSPSSVPV